MVAGLFFFSLLVDLILKEFFVLLFIRFDFKEGKF